MTTAYVNNSADARYFYFSNRPILYRLNSSLLIFNITGEGRKNVLALIRSILKMESNDTDADSRSKTASLSTTSVVEHSLLLSLVASQCSSSLTGQAKMWHTVAEYYHLRSVYEMNTDRGIQKDSGIRARADKEIFSKRVLEEFDVESTQWAPCSVDQVSMPLTDLVELLSEHQDVVEPFSNVDLLANSFLSLTCVEDYEVKDKVALLSPEANLWVAQLIEGIYGLEERGDAWEEELRWRISLVLAFLYNAILSHFPALLPLLVDFNDTIDKLPSSATATYIRDLRAMLKDTISQLLLCREEVLQKQKICLTYIYLSLSAYSRFMECADVSQTSRRTPHVPSRMMRMVERTGSHLPHPSLHSVISIIERTPPSLWVHTTSQLFARLGHVDDNVRKCFCFILLRIGKYHPDHVVAQFLTHRKATAELVELEQLKRRQESRTLRY